VKVGVCSVYRFVCLHVLHDETHGAGFDVGKSVDPRRDASLLLRPVDSKRLVQRTITFQFTVSNSLEPSGKCDAVASEVQHT